MFGLTIDMAAKIACETALLLETLMDLLVDGVGTDQIKEEYIAGLPRSEASFFRPASLRIAERVVVKDHHVSEIEVDIVPVEPETGK